MVQLSQWRPDGGYNYYEASGYVAPLGDDLPNPAMPSPTRFGVPSVEVGHPLPAGAKHVGEGALPRGVIAPMETSRLGQLLPACASPIFWTLLGAGVVGLVWLLRSRRVL